MNRTRRDIENELLWLNLRNGAPDAAIDEGAMLSSDDAIDLHHALQ